MMILKNCLSNIPLSINYSITLSSIGSTREEQLFTTRQLEIRTKVTVVMARAIAAPMSHIFCTLES